MLAGYLLETHICNVKNFLLTKYICTPMAALYTIFLQRTKEIKHRGVKSVKEKRKEKVISVRLNSARIYDSAALILVLIIYTGIEMYVRTTSYWRVYSWFFVM